MAWGLIAIIVISMILSLFSILNITQKAIRDFNPFIHITCLVGCLIILTLSVLDLLVITNSIGFILFNDFSSIYFLGTSLTSILSSYILIRVGSNFYQEYSYLKTILLFTPIIVSLGVFGMSVFIAVTIVLTNDTTSESDEDKFIIITYILNAISGFLSLIFGIFPLFSIKSQTALRPQQTAVSIVHFFIVVILFISHFIVYSVITFRGSELDILSNSLENMILILIFPGSLFMPPKGMVKFIKRMFLGVEQLTIGGDYRPNMLRNDPNMLQDNETNGSSSPIITQIIVPSISSDSNNDGSLSSRRSISTSSSPPISHSVSIVSTPAPEPRTTPNSASPKRNEPPLVKSRSLFYPRSYIRTRLQSFPGSNKSVWDPDIPSSQSQDYDQQQSENYPSSSQNYQQNYSQSQNFYKQPQLQKSQKSLRSHKSQQQLQISNINPVNPPITKTYVQQQQQIYNLPLPPPPSNPPPQQIYTLPPLPSNPPPQQIYTLPPPPSNPPPLPQIYNLPLPPPPSNPPQSYSYFVNPSQSMISNTSKGSSIGSDASFYLSKFTNNNKSSNGGASYNSSKSSKSNSSNSSKRQYHQPQFLNSLTE